MISTRPDVLLVPFGTHSFHPERFELAGFSPDGLRLWSASPCALINAAAGEALRLNGAPLPVATPAARDGRDDVEGELRLIEAHLARMSGEWARAPRAFLKLYFESVRAEVARHRAELERQLAPFAGLYRAEHWAFSALMPLPRAHLHLPLTRAPGPIDPADVVRVDFAFWTGAALVAVVLDGRSTPTPSQRRGRERLAAWNINLRMLDAKRLDRASAGALLAELGSGFARFWHGQRAPSGPPRGGEHGSPTAAPAAS